MTKLMPAPLSRVKVQVKRPVMISTAPFCNCGNASRGWNGLSSILSGSPSTAAASARQNSISKPRTTPLSSAKAKPAILGAMPQMSFPRCFTSSRVAASVVAIPNRPSIASDNPRSSFRIIVPLFRSVLDSAHTPRATSRHASGNPRFQKAWLYRREGDGVTGWARSLSSTCPTGDPSASLAGARIAPAARA